MNIKPKKGDLVIVEWLDISSSMTDDTDKDDLGHFIEPGLFIGYGKRKGIKVLKTAPSYDIDEKNYRGYNTYPLSVVKDVYIIKTKEEVDNLYGGEK